MFVVVHPRVVPCPAFHSEIFRVVLDFSTKSPVGYPGVLRCVMVGVDP